VGECCSFDIEVLSDSSAPATPMRIDLDTSNSIMDKHLHQGHYYRLQIQPLAEESRGQDGYQLTPAQNSTTTPCRELSVTTTLSFDISHPSMVLFQTCKNFEIKLCGEMLT